MAEEFDESEVVFSEDLSSDLHVDVESEFRLFGLKKRSKTRRNIIKRKEKVAALSTSLPVNIIPENMFGRYLREKEDEYSEEEEEYSDGGGEIVPPHVVVGGRVEGEMAFSVCSGSGRTLKGRDLSRVRNSVLRLTGFLEA